MHIIYLLFFVLFRFPPSHMLRMAWLLYRAGGGRTLAVLRLVANETCDAKALIGETH